MDNKETEIMSQPNMANSEPVQPVVEPVQPVVEPVQPVVEPVQPAVEPVQPVVEPVQPVVEPVQPVVEPVQPVVEPVQPVMSNVNPGMPNPQPTMNQGIPVMANNGNQIRKVDKKGLMIIGGIAAIVVLIFVCSTLFGGKTLKCSMKDTMDGTEMSQEIEVKFGKKSLKNMKMTMKITVDDEYADMIEEFAEYMADDYEDMEGQSGISVKSKTKGNVFTLTLDADFAKLSEEAREELGFYDEEDLTYDDANEAYNELKEELEDSGYTCK